MSPIPESNASASPMAIRWEEPGFCVAAHDSLVAVIWGRDARREDLEQLANAQRAAVDTHGHCAVMTVIRAGLSMSIGDGVREASEDNLREFADVHRGSALVVEAGGLRAAFFRSVITSVQLLARSPVSQKVFNNIDDSVTWLLEQPGMPADMPAARDEIIAGIYEIAERYGGKGA